MVLLFLWFINLYTQVIAALSCSIFGQRLLDHGEMDQFQKDDAYG